MYDKPFSLDISATSPFAYEKEGGNIIGITIVGMVRTQDINFLDDVIAKEKSDGLRRILTGELPIEGHIPIAFLKHDGLLLDFPGFDKIGCELTDIETGALDAGGNLVAKIKIKCSDIDADTAGEIVSNLKNVITIIIVKPQQELPFEEHGAAGAVAAEYEVLESGGKPKQLTEGVTTE